MYDFLAWVIVIYIGLVIFNWVIVACNYYDWWEQFDEPEIETNKDRMVNMELERIRESLKPGLIYEYLLQIDILIYPRHLFLHIEFAIEHWAGRLGFETLERFLRFRTHLDIYPDMLERWSGIHELNHRYDKMKVAKEMTIKELNDDINYFEKGKSFWAWLARTLGYVEQGKGILNETY